MHTLKPFFFSQEPPILESHKRSHSAIDLALNERQRFLRSRHCGQLKYGTYGLLRRGSRCGPRLILWPAPLLPWKGGGGGGENREEVVKRWEINGEKNDKWGGRDFFSAVGGHGYCEKPTARCFLHQSIENPLQRWRLILIREWGGMTKHQLLPLPQSK